MKLGDLIRNNDLTALFQAICDVPSVSGDERVLADLIEELLTSFPHLRVTRHGDAVVARTQAGHSRRVIVAGHIDTVPLTAPPNLPTRREGSDSDAIIWGRGTVDMKGGITVMLALACALVDPRVDITWIFYDHEEVAAELNGLGRIAREDPTLVAGDFAVLCEPTHSAIEGGCNGTLRAEIHVPGKAAHSARPWAGINAIHGAAPVLQRLVEHQPVAPHVDGLSFQESLNAVGIRGGIAGNVIPDECVITVNYRFAPDKTLAQAQRHIEEVFSEFLVVFTDGAPGARPGLIDPLAQGFVDQVTAHTGLQPSAKVGWTDVARFAELGIPAVNYGPGDPLLAHHDQERCSVNELHSCYDTLYAWLGGSGGLPSPTA